MNIFKRFLHWLEHLSGTNTGSVLSWSDDEFIYIGFECDVCKKIDSKLVIKIEKDKILNSER